ncbi:MAG: 2-keto-4-methylthiobutyrate aminotransferase [Alphaproteobacteria bacterium]|nr:2-keto-4-methylthiobutyrate aminotransferase [Alphaproteobacteria bacterium]
MTKIWLNGTICAGDKALSANERGFLLGEGLFETILIKSGSPRLWNAHIERLFHSCATFGFACPYDKATLAQAADDLIASKNNMVLRITVTGGVGGRGLVPPQEQSPTWLMQISPAPSSPAPSKNPALKLAVSPITRLADHISNAHKTTNYFDNILARRQALATGADEAVLLNQYGRVACAAAASIFIVKDNSLSTPPISEGAMNGIIRQTLLNLKTTPLSQVPIQEAPLTLAALHQADMILLCNSVIEVKAAYITAPAEIRAQNLAHSFIQAFIQILDEID